MTATPLLAIRGLTKHFPIGDGVTVYALNSVDLDLAPGETLGIVGESGCGKSTLGKAILRLIEPTDGTIRFDGADLLGAGRGALKRHRQRMQMIFQDPFGSLNPRHKIGWIIGEPLTIHRRGSRAEIRAKVADTLRIVGLDAAVADRYPHEFSGGQRQRIAIARAIILEPRLVIADEPVSALDVSIQSQILNLLRTLRERLKLALLFISHDLAVVRHVSDRVAVMYLGRVVELADTDALFAEPAHPYTRALLSAAPRADVHSRRQRIVLTGELPNQASPPGGCPFHPRCPMAMARCRTDLPALTDRRVDGRPRRTACHLFEPVGA